MTLGSSVRIPAVVILVLVVGGCATKPRELMPTPLIYEQPGGKPLFDRPTERSTAVDLLYITDRGEPTPEEAALKLPYGETRGRRLAFGSAKIDIEPPITWEQLEHQSQLGERTQPINLQLGAVTELGTYPPEPYQIEILSTGEAIRAPEFQKRHDAASRSLRAEIARRLEVSPSKEITLFVHGFNETFATAAFTAAELCHFLGREPVCAFFTWPASHTGNFLISYTNTTESAQYAVDHLKKTIRLIGSQPGVKRVHLLAHSRGAELMLSAAHQLLIETIAAGQEPVERLKLGELVLFSPDVDMEIAAQRITGHISDPDLITVWSKRRLPRGLHGQLTIYTSPEDRALLVARILFRSRHRLGQITADDIRPEGQKFLAETGKVNLITYEGKRTDLFGHSYFTTNPEVSSDVIQLLRYGKRLGEPGRELVQTGPVTWEFPTGSRRQDQMAQTRTKDPFFIGQ
ncbi:hypothetical protein CKO22_12350 [Thiococcus pfennigii]|nr:hypothetical protein [Thiococcus pfennigii]